MNKLDLFLVSLAWVLLAVASTFFAIRWSAPAIFAAGAAIPVAIFLISHQKLVCMLTLGTAFSGLVFPGLPATLTLHHLLVVFLIVIGVFGAALRKEHHPTPVYFYLLIAIILNLLVVIYMRGAGFRFLGDGNWGGTRYVDIFLAIGFILFYRTVTLSPKDWRTFFFLFIGLSMLPILSEALFLLSNGRIYHHYYFVRMRTATLSAFVQEMGGEELVRFQSGNRTGVLLALVASFLFYNNTRRVLLPFLLFTAGLLLVGFSGHRSGLVDLVLVAWLVGFMICKANRNLYLQASALGVGLLFVFLYFIGPSLPIQFQRTLVFIPGIDWAFEAAFDADATWQWRLNLWNEGLRKLQTSPDFYLFGKGFTYSGAEYHALTLGRPGEYNYWFAVILSTYHQGVLSLLIGMGIPGLLLFTAFFAVAIWRHVRFSLRQWQDPLLQKAHRVVLIYFVVLVMKYYTVYGDLFVSLPPMAFWLVMLECLIATHEQSMKKLSKVAAEEAPPPSRAKQPAPSFVAPALR